MESKRVFLVAEIESAKQFGIAKMIVLPLWRFFNHSPTHVFFAVHQAPWNDPTKRSNDNDLLLYRHTVIFTVDAATMWMGILWLISEPNKTIHVN